MTRPITSMMTAQMASMPKQPQQTMSQQQPIAQVKIGEELPAKKIKKGGFKETIASIWKGLVDIKSYTTNTVKGIYYGALSGAGVFGVSWLFKSAKNISGKVTNANGERLQTLAKMIATPFALAFVSVKHMFKDMNLGKILLRTASLPYKGFKIAMKSQNIGKFGKVLAPVVALGVLGGYLIKGKLDANKGEANVDHTLKTGHNEA